jgi:hypothetical protein
MLNKYCFFVLEVVKAWIDPKVKNPRTIHHHGKRQLYGCRRKDQIKIKDEVAPARLQSHPTDEAKSQPVSFIVRKTLRAWVRRKPPMC